MLISTEAFDISARKEQVQSVCKFYCANLMYKGSALFRLNQFRIFTAFLWEHCWTVNVGKWRLTPGGERACGSFLHLLSHNTETLSTVLNKVRQYLSTLEWNAPSYWWGTVDMPLYLPSSAKPYANMTRLMKWVLSWANCITGKLMSIWGKIRRCFLFIFSRCF